MSTDTEARLDRIKAECERMGLNHYIDAEGLTICDGHVRHHFPLRLAELGFGYTGQPDYGGTEYSIKAAEALLAATDEEGPTITFKLVNVLGATMPMLVFDDITGDISPGTYRLMRVEVP